jgi:hypothetical protein
LAVSLAARNSRQKQRRFKVRSYRRIVSEEKGQVDNFKKTEKQARSAKEEFEGLKPYDTASRQHYIDNSAGLSQKGGPPSSFPGNVLFTSQELKEAKKCQIKMTRPWRPQSQTPPMRHWSQLEWPGQPQCRLLQPSNAQPIWQQNAPPRLWQPHGPEKPGWHWTWQNCPSREEWGKKEKQVCSAPNQPLLDSFPSMNKAIWQLAPLDRCQSIGEEAQCRALNSQEDLKPIMARTMPVRPTHLPVPFPAAQADNISHQFQPPFFQKVRQNINWWKKAKASQEVQEIILEGVKWHYPIKGNLSMQPCIRNKEETNLAWETIQEYLEVGALKEICPSQARHLIPWFVIKKGKN